MVIEVYGINGFVTKCDIFYMIYYSNDVKF